MTADRPSVAVVVLDTLRADAFEAEFDWLSGVRFETAYSTSHWTVPAHASLFTGRYASEVGVHAKSPALDCGEQTLAEALRSAGYATRLWTANPQLFEWDGWGRGFDQHVGPYELAPTADDAFDWQSYVQTTDREGLDLYVEGLRQCLRSDSPLIRSLRHGYREYRRSPADGGTAAVCDRLRATEFGDREFLVVNLMEAHSPWEPPEPYRTVEGGADVTTAEAFAGEVADPDRIRRAYRDSVRYLSDAYADLFEDLGKTFDYVLTLSDHGELLGEGDLWNHGYGLAPELTRVPLVVSGDGLPDATRERPVSLLDVHRTVAELAGVEVESRGRDLLGESDPTDRLVEFHGFAPWDRDQFRREGVAETHDERDSPLDGVVTVDGAYAYGTHDDGLVVAAGECDRAAARLAALRDAVPRRDVSDATVEVSEAVRDRLEELGYA